MKFLYKAILCFFSIITLSSHATTVVLEWSGTLEEIIINEENNGFADVNVGQTFSGTFSYDTIQYNQIVSDPNYSLYGLLGDSSFSGINSPVTSSNIELNIANDASCGSFGGIYSCNTYSNILNSTITADSNLDLWYLANAITDSTYIYLEYVSNNESILSGTNFQALPPFELNESNENKRAIFWIDSMDFNGAWGYLEQVSVSEVPLPAGIYLFLSGLVGLGIIKKKNHYKR